MPLLGLTPLMGGILFLFYVDAPGWLLAFQLIFLAAAGFKVFEPSSAMERLDLDGLRTPTSRRRLRTGLAVGLVFGLMAVLLFELTGGLVSGLLVGLPGGLVAGNGSVWLRYAIAVRAAARQGSLPKRPARFLDWCLHTGLMRMVGIAIQFRHRRLQEALTPPDTSSVDSNLKSVPTEPSHSSAHSQDRPPVAR